MPKLPIDDGHLFYEIHGEGPPLFATAGLGGMGAFWRPQLEAWVPHFKVILHDHRGTGQSSRDRIQYSVPQMARDLIALADGLGIDRFHYVGHSTGAAIGQELALVHPSRLISAILSAGWPRIDPWFIRCFETRERLLLTAGPEAYIRAQALFLLPPWWVSGNDERLQEMEATQLASFPSEEIVRSRIAAITNYGPGEALLTIQTPCLIICAEDDHLTPPHFAEELHELIPNSDIAILPSGGHFNSFTRSNEFNETTLDWLLAQARGTDWIPRRYAKASTEATAVAAGAGRHVRPLK